jgi:hypothetical protein
MAPFILNRRPWLIDNFERLPGLGRKAAVLCLIGLISGCTTHDMIARGGARCDARGRCDVSVNADCSDLDAAPIEGV